MYVYVYGYVCFYLASQLIGVNLDIHFPVYVF